MCVLIFSTNFVSNVSCSKKNSETYCHNCTQVFMYSTGHSCQISNETLNFLEIFFEKSSVIKFHENLCSWSRVVPCGQTDGQTDATKLRAAFRNDEDDDDKICVGVL